MACVREGATPTDDGFLIVDCEVHGEVGRVFTGGSISRLGSDEYEAVSAAWRSHVLEG